MTATILFTTQVALSFLSYGLIARWFIYPRLRDRSLRDALTPLLLFQTFRTLGLIFLVPTLVDATLPAAFAVPGAVGDMLAVFLAFAALIAVRAGWRGAPALVWFFTVVGLLDFLNAFVQGIRFNIAANYNLGFSWLIPTFGVPAFAVVQLTVIALLLHHARQHEGSRPVDASVRLPPQMSEAR